MFVDDTIVHVENLDELTKKHLELISNYSKVARYKINKSESLSYIPVMNNGFKVKYTMLLTSVSPKMIYLRIKLTKYS